MSHKYPCVYYDNGKCQKFSDEQYTAWCDFDQCEHQSPSNGDRIRAMSDEELADFLVELADDGNLLIRDWLKQTYKEDA